MHTWLRTSVRAKIIGIVVLGILVTDVCIYVISQTVILGGYEKIEQRQVIQNLQQATDAFENKLTQMSVKIKDWAIWDASYYFAKDPASSNFIQETLSKNNVADLLDLDVFMYADLAGEQLYAQNTVSSDNGTESGDETANRLLTTTRLLATPSTTAQDGTRGIVSYSRDPLLVVSSPILQSTGEGAPAGTMFFGRFIDDNFVQKMSELTHLSLSGFPNTLSSPPADVAIARTKLSIDNNYYVQPHTNDVVAGYTSLYDLDNAPVFTVRVERSRSLFHQGQSTVWWFLIFTSTAFLICGIATIIGIEKFVISRLKRLSEAVTGLGEKHAANAHVLNDGSSDEIGRLTSAINTMLDDLAQAQKKEAALSASEKDTAEKLKERFDEVTRLNKDLIARELEMSELKEAIKLLQNRVDALQKSK